MDPPPPLLPPLTAHPKTLLMSWDGGCKVSWIWNHRHLCLMALSPLSENCPQAWFPFCSYIFARLECFPNPLAQRKRNKLQTICSYCLNEMLQDLIKTRFVIWETLHCWHHSFMDMESHFPESFYVLVWGLHVIILLPQADQDNSPLVCRVSVHMHAFFESISVLMCRSTMYAWAVGENFCMYHIVLLTEKTCYTVLQCMKKIFLALC